MATVAIENGNINTQARDVMNKLKPSVPQPEGEPTLDHYSPDERAIFNLAEKSSEEEKINFLLGNAIESERLGQRDDDEGNDHGIRLMSRQKYQSWKRVMFVFLSLNWIYGVQLVVEYNLGKHVGDVNVNDMIVWIETKRWTNPTIVPFPNSSHEIESTLRQSFQGSKIKYDQLYDLGWCLTSTGKFEAAFNVATGLVICYLFIFGDLFNVVMYMPLVRSFPQEPKGAFMLFANVWMVVLNGVVLTWLGVIAGEAVNGHASDFTSIINVALSVFIVVAIDNEVLPTIRALAEEFGYMDYRGVMNAEQLDRLTFGNQYYKPGYGHGWTHRFFEAPTPALRIIPIVLLLITIAIIITPGAIVASRAWNYLVPCP
jgi:hypothetical protein